MTRHEHIVRCKARALDYVERNELENAVASMISDLKKHEDTANHLGISIGRMLKFSDTLTSDTVRKWIEGFY